MYIEKKVKYIIGILATVVSVALILFVCVTIRTNVKSDINLSATPENDNGWSYEVLSNGENQSTQPEFIDEYTLSLPQTDISAIRIKRVMTETLISPYLRLDSYGVGVEVFLDDSLLFSNISYSERNSDGYLELSENYYGQSGESSEIVYVSLPEDYTGKTLTITSYFSDEDEYISPVFPILNTDETFYSAMVSSAFLPNIIITLCGIMALLLCAVFLFGIHYDRADYKLLLLIAFFIMLFVDTVYSTAVGQSSNLAQLINLTFLDGLYITPLFIYIALCLGKWRKYVLLSCSAVQFVYYCITMLINQINEEIMIVDDNYLSVFVVFVISFAMIIVEIICNRKNNSSKKYINRRSIITLICVIVVVTIVKAYTVDDSVIMYLNNIFTSSVHLSFAALVHLLSSIYAFMAAVTVISNFIIHYVNDNKNVAVVNERYRLALTNYKLLLEAEKETRRARHEMSHHVKAISTYLNENRIDDAKKYVASMSDSLNSLPAFRYCSNLLLNALVGVCVEQAQSEGIKVEYNLKVDETIGIDDSDLCVLVENMLDNALDSCRKIEPDKERFIRININQTENFLFIACTNTYNDTIAIDENGDIITTKENAENHGYGISAMKIVAEKYNSILKLEHTDSEFSVMTNLNLK
jgi:hypothetical protein